jgi:mycothiol system anti-sigma-R factor
MSDGCDGYLSELYLYLDRELDDATRLSIEVHLRQCSPCLEAFDFESDLRRVIADRCRDRVPDALRSRVSDALRRAQSAE